ncbi:MAG: ATP-binding protein [Bryobacteraceae bacterium]
MTSDPAIPAHDHLRLDADLAELERLTGWLDTFCESHGVDDAMHYHINVAVEEVVINAIKHGRCHPQAGAIEVNLTLAGDELQIEVIDTGVSFNPLELPPPELDADIAKRKIGGLGVHLVRSLMNRVEYERLEGRNRLRLTKRISGANDAG